MQEYLKLKPKTIVGERVYLRPYRKEDLKFMFKWMNDPEILGLVGEAKPWSREVLEEFYDAVTHEKGRAWFSIVLKDGNRVIGETGLLRAFWPWKQTDLTIEINEKDVWNHGYGTETINLLLSWAFDTLGFHRVSIGVVGFNDRALHFYEKNGFRREGVLRDGYLYDGKYYDFVMMSILEDEFRELHHGGPPPGPAPAKRQAGRSARQSRNERRTSPPSASRWRASPPAPASETRPLTLP